MVLKSTLVLSLVAYFFIAFHIKRTDHFALFSIFSGLVFCYILVYVYRKQVMKLTMLFFISGLLFRLVFTTASPKLSDDFFRFTWDGELISDGISPFSFKPKMYKSQFKDFPDLIDKYEKLLESNTEDFPQGMNSKQYYSIYPTFNQAVFYASSWVSSPNEWNLTFMRLLLVIAEVVSFFMLKRLLVIYGKSESIAFLYWLNPLVIIEIVGNLHFEGFAIMFMLVGLWLLEKNRQTTSAISVALAVATKLNPIFFLGAVYTQNGFKKSMQYGILVVLFVLGLFAIIFNVEYFQNFMKSFGLYFAWFEFNGGLYEFCNQLSRVVLGYLISDKLSLIFPVVTILLMLRVTFYHKTLITADKLALLFFIYFSFSPIVHPWYALLLLPFGILSGRFYVIIWTIMAFFSYSAYKVDGFNQDLWVVFLEYLIVYSVFILEYKTTVFSSLRKSIFT